MRAHLASVRLVGRPLARPRLAIRHHPKAPTPRSRPILRLRRLPPLHLSLSLRLLLSLRPTLSLRLDWPRAHPLRQAWPAPPRPG
jgi:hypothetical protein